VCRLVYNGIVGKGLLASTQTYVAVTLEALNSRTPANWSMAVVTVCGPAAAVGRRGGVCAGTGVTQPPPPRGGRGVVYPACAAPGPHAARVTSAMPRHARPGCF
jgi:hypothetical protein